MPDDRLPHHPSYHQLDRRADAIIAEAGDGGNDDLLDTAQVARWLGMSEVWVQIGRSKNYGPRFVALNRKRIRYRRCDVIEWLRQRTYACTDQYDRVVVGQAKANAKRAAARAALPPRKVGFKRGDGR
jgi:hypothetical protein